MKSLVKFDVPSDYFFDFLRGFFDGDGSYNSYWDRRWKSSFMFYTKFASISGELLKWLRKELIERLEIRGSMESTEYEERAWSKRYILKYAKADTKSLVRRMYYEKGLPCLERKKKKIAKILSIESS